MYVLVTEKLTENPIAKMESRRLNSHYLPYVHDYGPHVASRQGLAPF